MKNLASIIILFFISANIVAQTNMIIRKTDHSVISIPISEVDSVYYMPAGSFICGTQIMDIDSNTYGTVQIGAQCWMSENLRVTHYPNGDEIPYITDNTEWMELDDNNIDDAYCWYNNDSNTYANKYGGIYTYAAAIADNWQRDNVSDQGVCPDGWHLPSDEEWKTLEIYLGMSASDADLTGWRGTDQGSKLSNTASMWQDGNLEYNTNFGLSGFNAIPGGARSYSNGTFYNLGVSGYYWYSTEYDSEYAYNIYLNFDHADSYRGHYYKSKGYYVRCIKD